MSELAKSYRAARAGDAAHPGTETAALEEKLARLYRRARDAHPDATVDERAFGAHLARFGGALMERAEALVAGDLFLAFGAVAGDATAVAKLRQRCTPVIARFVRPLSKSKTFMDDFVQDLWEALLVGRASGRASLLAYSGRGPLEGFVGITARRMALNRLRHHRAQARAAARGVADTPTLGRDAELGFIKRRYRDAFQAAIEDAIQTLDDREREILCLHVVDGLTVERIGKLRGVSQSTVSRWIAAARTHVLAEARKLLRKRIPISKSEFDSLAKLLASEIDLSLSRVSPRPRERG